MDVQNNKPEDLYLLIVYSPYVVYCESVCFFTNYEHSIVERDKLQERINTYQSKQKEYWKERTWYPEPPQNYGNPKAAIVKVRKEDIDKINPSYIDIIDKYDIRTPLDKTPSTGKGCWFDFLKNQKKECTMSNDQTQAMYLVVDYYLKENYSNSQVVGVFTNPEAAYNIQSKILASYGMDAVFTTYDETHYVQLCSFISNNCVNPEEPYYKWC